MTLQIIKWVIVLGLALLIGARLVKGAGFALRADPAAALDKQPEGEIAQLLEPIRARHKVPGMAAAIIAGGELVELGVVGVRRAGSAEAITADDLFHIGSCTKAMTATMLAVLVEKGRLKWETTVGEVFDDVEMDEGWKGVTLAELLHNRGGAPAELNADGLWGRLWSFEGTPRGARMELVRGVLSRPPRQRGQYLYSNAGYAMAGAMAERVMDASWEELMRRHLLEPLGMTTAGFGAPGWGDALDQPRGHHASGRVEEPGPRADNPPAIGPAGTVHCSLADWARFVGLHQTGGKNEGSLLGTATIAKLQTPADGPGERYAMGWLVTQRSWAKGDGPGLALTHAGSNTLWYAVVWMAPERDFAVLVVCNQGGAQASMACDEAAGALIGKWSAAGAKSGR
jgi:CubicO group peptidase (beta-lactamase class C family)